MCHAVAYCDELLCYNHTKFGKILESKQTILAVVAVHPSQCQVRISHMSSDTNNEMSNPQTVVVSTTFITVIHMVDPWLPCAIECQIKP